MNEIQEMNELFKSKKGLTLKILHCKNSRQLCWEFLQLAETESKYVVSASENFKAHNEEKESLDCYVQLNVIQWKCSIWLKKHYC